MNQIDWNPAEKKLREFGFVIAIVAIVMAGFIYWNSGWQPQFWAWVAASIFCPMIGLFRPRWLRSVFILLSLVTFPIGWVVSLTLLTLIYFGMFTPLSWLRRFMNQDPLNLRLDRNRASFWQKEKAEQSAESYFKQY